MRTRRSILVTIPVVAVLGFCLPLPVSAQSPQLRPLAIEAVPAELQPWISWAIVGSEEQRCPGMNGVAQSWRCAWPGELVLRLDEEGGTFEQRWRLYRSSWVPLPGDTLHWPQEVQSGSARPAVITIGQHPAVQLPAGNHLLRGRFQWSLLPESLPLPGDTGLLDLQVRGMAIPLPRLEEDGRLVLSRTTSEEERVREHLQVSVHRRLQDGVPVVLTTRLLLDVAGRAREVLLAKALPDGFVPFALDSPLPARLEDDGHLRVQVRAGRWELLLQARHQGPLAEVTIDPGDLPWGPNEVWVFAADAAVRVVEVEGVPPTDPRQTSLPDEWHNLPAYRLFPGDTLRLVEKRRGDADPAADNLTLNRALWLDFDGRGYTIQDSLSGRFTRSWRLQMLPETTLGHVAIGDEDQLITRLDTRPGNGAELRLGSFTAVAESRLEEARGSLPAVGWDHDVDQLGAVLHLPPAWQLLTATGVDRARGSWFSRWSLLDLFLCCIAVMAVARLRGGRWAVLAAACLALTWTEPRALQWTWLWLLAALALAEYLPAGRARTLARWWLGAMLVAVVLGAIPFVLREVRLSLYPNLARSSPSSGLGAVTGASQVMEDAEQMAQSEPEMLPMQSPISSPLVSYKPLRRSQWSERDKQVATQTGPGVPSWAWQEVSLQWSGPVQREQRLRLVLLPPWCNRPLGVVRCLLMVVLVLGLLRPRQGSWRTLLPGSPAAAVATSLLVAVLLAPSPVSAATGPPSDELLGKLRKLVLEPPECAPSCAVADSLALQLERSEVRLQLEIHSYQESAVPLPGGTRWLPEQVRIDNSPALGLVRQEGSVWVLAPAGRHRLRLTGPLPQADVLRLPLPLRPRRVTVQARGWRVDGVHDDGQVEEVLQLTRLAEQGSAPSAGETATTRLSAGELPPHLTVTRSLDLQLTWQVLTTVHRLSPAGTPIVIEVPLLPGESVTSAGVHVEEDRVLVNMAPGASELSWTSSLEIAGELRLVAPAGYGWAERWRLRASPLWHVQTAGIPPVHQPVDNGERLPEWRPWPGEELLISAYRPDGTGGATVTIDSTLLEVRPGQRATTAELDLRIRSSLGGTHDLLLPDSAQVTRLALAGNELPVHQDGSRVQVQLSPGSTEVQLAWRQTEGICVAYHTPQVDLTVPGVNTELKLHLPHNRWLLWVNGPGIGPAVLYWSLLVVLVAVAVALGRVSALPLRSWQWLLLLLGLSQVPVAAGLLVIGWFAVLVWRRQRAEGLSPIPFNLAQLVLVGWTLVMLLVLFAAVYQGLLDQPRMHVAGNQSHSQQLNWYQDRSEPQLPQVWVLSLPLVAYRLTMLAWALWLAAALTRWLRWGWDAFGTGTFWKRIRSAPPEPPPEPEEGRPDGTEQPDPAEQPASDQQPAGEHVQTGGDGASQGTDAYATARILLSEAEPTPEERPAPDEEPPDG